MKDDRRLSRCQDMIGYTFADAELLRQALTHPSAREQRGESNQRLEFLGDSILGLVVTELLYTDYPHLNEGRMTKVKAQAVSRQSLEAIAREMGLAEFLIVGRMFSSPEEISGSVLADAVEALIAAIFLDGGRGGYKYASEFIYDFLQSRVDRLSEAPGSEDSKSVLGQWCQRLHGTNPEYVLDSVDGPDHELVFRVSVQVAGEEVAHATGASKKAAEQEAARIALENVVGED